MDTSADRQRDLDAFIVSASAETRSQKFTEWAGAERLTLAIVFTDVVGSTVLGEVMKDERMNEIRRGHFAQSRSLIEGYNGYEIKTMGDSFMVAFSTVEEAFDYARALKTMPGPSQVQIRAGIHIGPMEIEDDDVFGRAVNFAARVIGASKGAEFG
jgi:class 3 adenylate cyclase